MTYANLFWHLLGWLLPAIVLAPAMVLASRLLWGRPAGVRSWRRQVGLNLGVCVLVLLGGLLWFGADGRMGTYGALVLASAACQAVLASGTGRGGAVRKKQRARKSTGKRKASKKSRSS